MEIAALIGARNEMLNAEYLRYLETYERAFQKFRQRNFREAKILLSQFLEFYPNNALVNMYLEPALEYEEAPPIEAWNAVEIFEKK